jgi:hypothetical protein
VDTVKMIAEYLEHALPFERMAAEATERAARIAQQASPRVPQGGL